MIPRAPASPLFPYTTLFRSLDQAKIADPVERGLRLVLGEEIFHPLPDLLAVAGALHVDEVEDDQPADVAEAELIGDLLHRSEEHTSELQSQFHLVCRLLLEK